MKTLAGSLFIGCVALVVGLLAAGANHAQTPGATPAMPVGVVDLVKVFHEFEQTKALKAELDRYTRTLTDRQQKKDEELTVERETLQGFAPDSAEYRERAKKLKKLIFDYQAELAAEREILKDEHRRWIERTYTMITESIAAVARKKGLLLVLTREELEPGVEDATALQKMIVNRKVVYHDPHLDLTDEVLAGLNDRFAKAGGAASIKLGF